MSRTSDIMIIKRFIMAVVFIAVTATVLGSFYTIDDGTVGVVSRFGEYDDKASTAGLNWKTPFIEDVTTMDVKMQTVNYKAGMQDENPNDGVQYMPSIRILDSKNLPIGLELTVQYTPDALAMPSTLRTLGYNYFDKQINPAIRDVVRDVASAYEAETIATKREEIGNKIEAELQSSFKDMPYILNNVALRNIALPATVAEKVKQVQEAKQEEQRLAMVEKQALVNKRIAVIDAQKSAEVKIEKARGVAQSIRVKSIEQAQANKRVSASLTSLLVEQNRIQQWNGAYPTTMMGQDTGVLFNLGNK